MNRPGQAHAVVLRSPHAHARILSMDVSEARAAPGVVAVLTGHDAMADGVGALPVQVEVPGKDKPLFAPTRHILQTERVRYVGDPVALVVAETRDQAMDAAELIQAATGLLQDSALRARLVQGGKAVLLRHRTALERLRFQEVLDQLPSHWSAARLAHAAPALSPLPPSR
jgi:xanthine dehydrogenase molybdopterin-binding subunit B